MYAPWNNFMKPIFYTSSYVGLTAGSEVPIFKILSATANWINEIGIIQMRKTIRQVRIALGEFGLSTKIPATTKFYCLGF